MAEIMVRVLGESEWSLYRDVRLRALAESPGSFTASLAEESVRGEQFWRDRMTRSHRLVAERGDVPQGIVSVGPFGDDPTAAEGFRVVRCSRRARQWRVVAVDGGCSSSGRAGRTCAAVLLGGNRERPRHWFREQLRIPIHRRSTVSEQP